jgi:orotate phosphoribosyltransferase
MDNSELKKDISLELARIGALKFGQFTFKSGLKSPMYMDLRLFVSYPKLLKKVAKAYSAMLDGLKYDRIAGVAYAAMPIAGAISLEREEPWIFLRKEAAVKAYGLQRALEGEYKAGESVVVVEDLVSKGTSVLEVFHALKTFDLDIRDVAVLIDYGKGGRDALEKEGLNLHAFMSMEEVVRIMFESGKIDDNMLKQCIEFIGS